MTFLPWPTVYHIFHRWSRDAVLASLNDRLRAHVPKQAGKDCLPTAAILDSQIVRSAAHGGAVGWDAGKKIKGRKRFLLVDTLDLVLAVGVCPANTPERAGAKELLEPVLPYFKWLLKLWVDGGYSGPEFAAALQELRPKLEVEVIKRSDDTGRFAMLPKRWVVERTLGWFMQHRRLVRDYEQHETSATGWIIVVRIRIMLRKLV